MIDAEEQLRRYWASSPRAERAVPVIIFTHSRLARRHVYWTERYSSNITLSTGEQVTTQPANMVIKHPSSESNLDQTYNLTFDLTNTNDTFREALDQIPVDTDEAIALTYLEYLLSNLTSPKVEVSLTIVKVSYTSEGATFTATTPRMNTTRTGTLYTPQNFPMLRGFL